MIKRIIAVLMIGFATLSYKAEEIAIKVFHHFQ
jgi:hypothetical protein